VLEGALDAALLRDAVHTLVERHEILRTTFHGLPGMDVPIQVIGDSPALVYQEYDLRDQSPEEQRAAIATCIQADGQCAFDFKNGPLAHCSLLAVAPERHILLVNLCALCGDARTLVNLAAEIGRVYATRSQAAMPLDEPVQYTDYAEWYYEILETDAGDGAEGKEFWRKKSITPLPVPSLPFEGQPAPSGRFAPERIVVRLDSALAEQVAALVAQRGRSVAALLLACFQTLLWRLTQEPEIGIGAFCDGRKFEQLSDALGLYGLYLPLQGHFEAEVRFSEILELAHESIRANAAWQEFFSWDARAAAARKGGADAALLIQFHFEEWPAAVSVNDLRISLDTLYSCTERFKLRLFCAQAGDSLRLEFQYDHDIYPAEQIRRLAGQFETVLGNVIKDLDTLVGDLAVLSAEERRQLLVEWVDTATSYRRDVCFHELFAAQAERTPDAIAVVFDAGLTNDEGRRMNDASEPSSFVLRRSSPMHLTYAELNRRANQLAQYLRRLGVGREMVVALCMDRSAELLVGLLGILKAGAAYIALDPGLPPARLRFILEDTHAPVLLTTTDGFPGKETGGQGDKDRLDQLVSSSPWDGTVVDLRREWPTISQEPDQQPPAAVAADDLIYVLYTSGSTGTPNGVMIQHGSVVHLLTALRTAVYSGQTAPLRVSMNAPLAFDASVKQLVQLCEGHTLCLVPEEARRDGAALLSYIQRVALDVLDCTPTQLRLLLLSGLAQRPDLTPALMLIGGEALDEASWAFLGGAAGTRAYNVYGPTECTVDATVARVSADLRPPMIGRAIANLQIYLLDDRLRPVPLGVPGELYIAGAGVARGYFNRPDLTAERFVPNPYATLNAERRTLQDEVASSACSVQPSALGGRLYRTGDLARYWPDGNLEFIGRRDQQVKLRGVRIELSEIEAALQQHAAVQEVVVLAREDAPGDQRLVAYVVPRRAYAATIEGRARYLLPNGLAVVHQNKNETDYLYQEIFEKRAYVQHGITLPNDACVFDVGANIGMFTLFVGWQCPGARIYAFEPIAPIFETLRINSELYGSRAKLFPFGLSDREKTEAFTYYPRYSMMSGISAYADPSGEVEVVKRFLRNEQDSGVAGATVLLDHADALLEERFVGEPRQGQLKTLSQMIRAERIERIDVLKVDVQRAELDVLRGIDEADWDKIDQIVMEVHDAPGRASAGRVAQIAALLERHGYATVAEQDVLLEGTDRYMLYAIRRSEACRAGAPQTNPVEHTPAPPPAILVAGPLRQFLKERLPEYMVPAAFVLLDRLPVTRNGKVDRRSLPAPEQLRPEVQASYLAPRTQSERVIAAIWQLALRIEKVGVKDNFFDLGGHSLLMVQVHSKLREAFGKDISMVDMFQHPTISALATFLSDEQDTQDIGQEIDDQAQRQIEALRQQKRRAMERTKNL
jgi:amino acid adenylation domain-containing protein/FkbM family methyltransferase